TGQRSERAHRSTAIFPSACSIPTEGWGEDRWGFVPGNNPSRNPCSGRERFDSITVQRTFPQDRYARLGQETLVQARILRAASGPVEQDLSHSAQRKPSQLTSHLALDLG